MTPMRRNAHARTALSRMNPESPVLANLLKAVDAKS